MLTNFGVARAVDDATLTRSGLIAGTPHYISTEQARGNAVDTRSDLFSLGSVLYAMSTGRSPFRRTTAESGDVRKVGVACRAALRSDAAIGADSVTITAQKVERAGSRGSASPKFLPGRQDL